MSSGRILIVEDDSLLAMNIAEILAEMGHEVVGCAKSGDEALTLAEQARPSFVVMDIGLPGGMDGIAVAEELRRRHRVPVVFLTGHTEADVLERAKRVEPYGFILKPYGELQLRSAIELAIYRHEADKEIGRLNRLYQVLSHVNQTISRVRTREDLLPAVCRLVVERGGMDLAWIGWLNPAGTLIEPIACHGTNLEHLSPIAVDASSSFAKAFQDGTVAVCGRCEPGKPSCPLRSAAFPLGLQSCASFPFRFQDEFRGILTVAVTEPEFFSPGETELFNEIAQDLTHALDAIEADERRRRAEEALAEEATWRRVLIDESRDGIVILDENGKVYEANRRYAEMLGYSPEEIRTLHVWDWDAQWTRDELKQRAQNRNSSPDYFETRHRRKDGSVFDVEISSNSAVCGSRRLVFCVCRDISERKRAEKALRDEKEKLDKIAGVAPGVIHSFRLRPDGTSCFPYASSRIVEIYGMPAEALMEDASGIRAVTHPDDVQGVVDSVGDSARTLAPWYHEFRLIHPEKGEIWVQGHSTPMREPDGSVLWHGFLTDITERKRAEEKLRKSEAQFQTVVESLSEGLVVSDMEGNLLHWNRAGLEMHGFESVEECQGAVNEFADIFALESIDGAALSVEEWPLNRVLRGEDVRNLEVQIRRPKSGWRRIYSCGGSLIRDPHGLPLMGFLTMSDITERKMAEVSARKEIQQTELLLDLYSRASQMADNELFEYALNKAVELTDSDIGFFHGVSEDQNSILLTSWNGKALQNCSASFSTHYPIGLAGNWTDCIRTKAPVVYNDFANSPNQKGLPPGHTAVKRLMTIPVMEGNRVRLIFGVGNKAEDYTSADIARLQVVANELHKIIAQRQAQAALRASNKRFRDVTEAAGEFIWEVDDEGCFTYVSQACSHLLGYAEEEVVGKLHFYDLHPESGRAEFRDAIFARMAQKAVLEDIQHFIKAKDGQVLDVLTSGVPILADDGALLGYRGMDRNITERKRAEKEKEKLEAQLLQAQKMESIGRLAGGVAHDFNNMLCVILGHAQLAMLPLDPVSPTYESLMEIQEAAQRSADLTRQLLAFARKQTVHPQDLDLNEAVAGTIKMLRRLIGEDIDLAWAPAQNLWQVNIDPSQIDQILANLAVNARDAITGTGTVTLRTQNVVLKNAHFANETSLVDGDYVSLSIADTGAGMTRDVLEHIFEPFFTTKEVGKGTGLGLATVYGIVKQNNGFVDVKSDLGKGTTFTIYLPRLSARLAGAAPRIVTLAPRGGSETILLVDDESAVVDLGQKMLAGLGYNVLIARTPDEALRLVEAHDGPIHLLVTDVVMPGMNGRELADRLTTALPKLKSLFVSGHPAEVIARRGVLEPGVSLLEKPFSVQELAEKVRKALD